MKLTVKPLKQKDAGRRLAAIDRVAADEMDLSGGDFIRIESRDGTAVARVWPGYPEDDGTGVVRIDGQLRQEASVGIDDRVTIEKADVEPAERVTIALPQRLGIRGNLESLIRRELGGRPVTTGQSVQLPLGFGFMGGQSQAIPLKIASTTPSGTVVVTDSTEVEISQRPAEEIRDAGPEDAAEAPDVAYEDIGGLDQELEQVREMIELPMRHPELFKRLGIEPPKGVLLHGPPGTGKTLIAKAVANEIDASFHTVSGPEIMSKYYGESEEQLREVFEEATEEAPAIIFMDELDSIAAKREEASGDVERRVVAQLLSLMDGLEERGQVVVIGATNRVDSVDPALRRPGRFDREIEIGVPDEVGRKEILQIHTRGMPLSDDVSLDHLADETHGFVGADVESLTKEAAMKALRRYLPEIDLDEEEVPPSLIDRMIVKRNDFSSALTEVEPSAMREVLVELPKISWDDVGGLNSAKEQVQESVEWPLTTPEKFDRMGVDAPKGVLLYGPPGTGKTLMAKAVANETNANFISVRGPQLLSKWVGESEKAIRQTFRKARQVSPTIIFFDELDSLAPSRGQEMGNNVSERVVNQLLTELDGLEEMGDVMVIGATNRPDMIDPALIRSGRFDRLVMIGQPNQEGREQILEIHTKNTPLAPDVSLREIAEITDGYVGSDLEGIAREAAIEALRDDDDAEEVEMKHFRRALESVRPTINEDILAYYEEIEQQFKGGGTEGLRDTGGRIGFQ